MKNSISNSLIAGYSTDSYKLNKRFAIALIAVIMAIMCLFTFTNTTTAQAVKKNWDETVVVGNNTKVVFIGDSYALSYNSNWPDQTAVKSGLESQEDYTISRRGGAGFGRKDAHAFLTLIKNASVNLTSKQRQKVQYVVIAGGCNDTNYVDAWKKYNNDDYRDGEEHGLKPKIREAINTAIEKFPNAKILIGAIGHYKDNATYNNYMQFVGLWYKEVAKEYSTDQVLYMYKAFGGKCLNGHEDLYKDSVHPNEQGGALIAEAISGYINIR